VAAAAEARAAAQAAAETAFRTKQGITSKVLKRVIDVVMVQKRFDFFL
jgi:hypothetical protein